MVVPPLWGTREEIFVFLGLFVHAAVRGETCDFHVENCQHADQQ